MSISGHKLYGPKGIGAVYVRRRPRVRIEPLFNGGGQERGIRSGTVPAPLVVGFGEACRIAKREMAVSRTSSFSDSGVGGLSEDDNVLLSTTTFAEGNNHSGEDVQGSTSWQHLDESCSVIR